MPAEVVTPDDLVALNQTVDQLSTSYANLQAQVTSDEAADKSAFANVNATLANLLTELQSDESSDQKLATALAALQAVVAALPTQPGGVASLAAYGYDLISNYGKPGDSIGTKFIAAVQYNIANRTHFPIIMTGPGQWDFRDMAGKQPTLVAGMRVAGIPGLQNPVEFRNQVDWLLPAGGLCNITTGKAGRDICISDFSATLIDKIVAPLAQGQSKLYWYFLSIVNFGTFGGDIPIDGIAEGCTFQANSMNGVTQGIMRLSGSDSQVSCGGKPNYASGQIPQNGAFFDFPYMSKSNIETIYATPQGGIGFRVGGSAGGLRFINPTSDCWSRTGVEDTAGNITPKGAAPATQLAGFQINGGTGVTFIDPWIDNANASGRAKALFEINGGTDHIIVRPQFWGKYDGQTSLNTKSPVVYVGPGASAHVNRPRALGGYGPNLATLLKVAAGGTLTCDDPAWAVTAA